MVRWLAGICWAVAAVTDSHHDLLRAGVFVGLDQLRNTFADAGPVLSARELEAAEFFKDLYHCSLMGVLSNSSMRMFHCGLMLGLRVWG